jgi:hypothetical protein
MVFENIRKPYGFVLFYDRSLKQFKKQKQYSIKKNSGLVRKRNLKTACTWH